jgi:ABC-2 type transport system ATP-binding protein
VGRDGRPKIIGRSDLLAEVTDEPVRGWQAEHHGRCRIPPVSNIVEAVGLTKRFGEVRALDGLDLSVPEGTVLGLLGPNGAGKTTAVSILTTLLEPDEGTARVAGADVRTEPAHVRQRIGLSGQYAAVDEHLTGFENLDMIGRLYRMGRTRSRQRARELLERFSLVESADRPVKTYSGGMRRRLDVAGALVAQPPVLFLDEPTTGLDPRSRTELWTLIRELVASGATLLLTTQYLEEADQLADDIVVIDHGRAIAHGTADQLKRDVGGERIEVVVTPQQLDEAVEVLRTLASGDVQIERHTQRVLAPAAGGTDELRRVMDALESHGITIREIGVRRPTLDDVFLTLTGHAAEPQDDEADRPDGPAPDGAGPDGAAPDGPAPDGAGSDAVAGHVRRPAPPSSSTQPGARR